MAAHKETRRRREEQLKKLKCTCCLLILKAGLSSGPWSSQSIYPRKGSVKNTQRNLYSKLTLKGSRTGKILALETNEPWTFTCRKVSHWFYRSRVQVRQGPAVWDEGQMLLLQRFHFAFWIFDLCTERMNFTQDNYELIQITPHKYEWWSVFWTGGNARYKSNQKTWGIIVFFLIKKSHVLCLQMCLNWMFLVLGEIYMACQVFGSERGFPSGRALWCVCVSKPCFRQVTRSTLSQMVNLPNHSYATSERKQIQ